VSSATCGGVRVGWNEEVGAIDDANNVADNCQ